MAEIRDSSLLFSLEGLLAREKERVAEEAAFAAQKLREAELKRALEIREAERAEAERAAAFDRRRLERERREREEAARLEAIRQAELERARVQAEATAALARAESLREHEMRMAAIRTDAGQAKSRWAAILCGLFAATAVLGAGMLYFGKVVPEAERLAQLQSLAASEHERANEATRLAERAAREREQLGERVMDLEKRPASAASAEPVRLTPKSQPKPVPSVQKPPKNCNPNDPMAFCL